MSSALGKQLGLTSESSAEEIVIALGNIIDYSNTIQTALEGSSSDNSVSRYRVNGNYIEVAPASGLWNNWDWEVSCIKVLKTSIQGSLTGSFSGSASWGSTSKSQTFKIPEGITQFFAVAFTAYGNRTSSTKNRQSHCSISVPSYISVNSLLNFHANDHTFYDSQYIANIYTTNGNAQTITMSATNSGSMHYWCFGVIYIN